MFEDSLVQDKIKTHSGRMAILAYVVQALAIAALVIIPLMFTQALPLNVSNVSQLVAPPPPPPPPPPPGASAAHPATAKVTPKAEIPVTHELTAPVKIPQKIAMVRESAEPAPSGPPTGVIGGVVGGVAGGQVGGVLGGVLNSVGTNVPKIAAPARVRVSQGVSSGLLVHKVTPQYPPLAKQAHIQGQVVLHAQIGKDGTVQGLEVVQGHPMLTAAAVEAVKQWKYKPYYLNGQPVAVDTTINVNFTLNG